MSLATVKITVIGMSRHQNALPSRQLAMVTTGRAAMEVFCLSPSWSGAANLATAETTVIGTSRQDQQQGKRSASDRKSINVVRC